MKIILYGVIGLLLAGCGGGESGHSSSKLQPGVSTTIYFSNEADAPASEFAAETEYTEQQFTRDVNPRYGSDAHAIRGVGGIVVHLKAQPPQSIGLVVSSSNPTPHEEPVNSWMDPSGTFGVVCFNEKTIDNWPARMNHVALNLLDKDKLIGQRFEAHNYNPLDFTETKLNGKYWLCDWILPPGATNCRGIITQDWLGVAK